MLLTWNDPPAVGDAIPWLGPRRIYTEKELSRISCSVPDAGRDLPSGFKLLLSDSPLVMAATLAL